VVNLQVDNEERSVLFEERLAHKATCEMDKTRQGKVLGLDESNGVCIKKYARVILGTHMRDNVCKYINVNKIY